MKTSPTETASASLWNATDTDWKRILPSWLLSACVHLLIALTLVWFLRPRLAGSIGDPSEEIRLVGIYEVSSRDEGALESESDAQDRENNSVLSVDPLMESADSQDALSLPDAPPVELPGLPNAISRIGLGKANGANDSSSSSDPSELIRPSQRDPENASSGSGIGAPKIQFLGTQGTGKSFVYVIDASASMREYGAILMAKAQLMASLEQMTPDQDFQIIFYNIEHHPLALNDHPPALIKSTDFNRTLARRFIESIEPDGGTLHEPAIDLALSFKPDVIFLLTDAEQPILSDKQLNKIKRGNRGTVIHSIEFGNGPPINVDNFMKKLARQNRGSYIYHNVRDFQKRP